MENSEYLQSRLIPTAKHFLNRQYWHRFRFKRITKHFPSRKQRYSICFWMLRRKKPCRECQMQKSIHYSSPPSGLMPNEMGRMETYLASFARRHTVVVARRLVSAHLTRYDRFCRRTAVWIGSGKWLVCIRRKNKKEIETEKKKITNDSRNLCCCFVVNEICSENVFNRKIVCVFGGICVSKTLPSIWCDGVASNSQPLSASLVHIEYVRAICGQT